MNIIETKIEELVSLYNSVLSELTEMTEDNFDKKLTTAKSLAISANTAKKDLFSNFDKTLVGRYEKDLNELTKQIQRTYDNIIEDKQKQLSALGIELKNIQNKKKMVVYGR